MIKDKIADYAYDAKLAGLNYHIDNHQYGIFIKIDGFNEKQSLYLTKFLDEVIQCELNAKRFDALKDFYILDLKNFEKQQPYKQIDHYVDLLLSEMMWSKEDLLKEAEDVNLLALKNFRPLFFNNAHIESLIVGNTNEEIAKTLLKIAVDSLEGLCKTKPLFSFEIRSNRTLKLPYGCNYFFEMENKTHPNSALSVLFQTSMENPLHNMLIELIEQILCEPFFDQLRTKEQLETMSLEDFEEQKDALATVRLEKKKNLRDQGDKLWDEIYLHQYHFDRDNAEVEILKSIKQDDVLRYFKDHLSVDGPKRRKLSIHIYSSEKWAEKKLDCGSLGDTGEYKALPIHDIKAFKSSLPFYDPPKPYLEIPTAGIEEAKL
uniref:Uncharacterized protein n=1 Tax=Romanomermis culicivorax TaxID=13658 RepID=A0A915IH43_ROMCU